LPPVSDPVKLQILDDLQTTLEGINGGATYYNTVAKVYRRKVALPDVNSFPSIIVTPEGTGYDNGRSAVVGAVAGSYRIELTLLMRAANDVPDEVEKLIHDVHTALFADITRGNLALNTRVVRDDVFYPADQQDPICGAVVQIEIDYRAPRTDLTTPQT
jgi:YHS domain-containing protein